MVGVVRCLVGVVRCLGAVVGRSVALGVVTTVGVVTVLRRSGLSSVGVLAVLRRSDRCSVGVASTMLVCLQVCRSSYC